VGLQKLLNKGGRSDKSSLQDCVWNLYTKGHLFQVEKCAALLSMNDGKRISTIGAKVQSV
jgi:hypothetical protein